MNLFDLAYVYYNVILIGIRISAIILQKKLISYKSSFKNYPEKLMQIFYE